MFGWIRPLRREFWSLVPYWRRAHRFMGNQALTAGGLMLSVFIAAGFSKTVLLTTLYITLAAALYGSLVEQPEVLDDESAGDE